MIPVEPHLGEFEGWKAVRIFTGFKRDKPFGGAHFAHMTYGFEDRARCGRNELPHQPVWGCHCGFYALSDPTDNNLEEAFMTAASVSFRCDYPTMPAIANVSLWGHVQEATAGYRAEYQRINSLWVYSWQVEQCKRLTLGKAMLPVKSLVDFKCVILEAFGTRYRGI